MESVAILIATEVLSKKDLNLANVSQIKVLPLSKLRERINQVKRIDLTDANIDLLKDLINSIITGYSRTAITPIIGQRLYRAVPWVQKPKNVRDLKYVPFNMAKQINKNGRAHRKGESKFYCSVGRNAPFYEIRAKAGDLIAISQWEVTGKIFTNIVADESTILEQLGSIRTEANFNWKQHNPRTRSPSERLVDLFLAKEFTRSVSLGNEHQYAISIAITERLMGKVFDESGTLLPAGINSAPIGGLLYPAVEMWGNADNLVLTPEATDNHLRLINVEYVRVDKQIDKQFEITKLDFANTFSSSGEIEWKGRLPKWEIQANGGTLHLSVENGEWVARTLDGTLVDPE